MINNRGADIVRVNDKERQAVNDSKAKLITFSILAMLRFKGQFVIETDTRDKLVGSVLLKVWKSFKVLRIGSWRKTLNDAKTKYITTQEKGLSAVGAVLMLRFYIEGNRIFDRTDNQQL